jgi:hypothetical protein
MEIKNMAAIESTRNKEWKNDQKEYEKHESLLDTFFPKRKPVLKGKWI